MQLLSCMSSKYLVVVMTLTSAIVLFLVSVPVVVALAMAVCAYYDMFKAGMR